MGNSNTTRKVTVPNDDPAGVIKVSEAVVQRLKGATEEGSRPTQLDVCDPTTPASINTQIPPVGSLTALQIRQAKEEELKKSDEYWMARLRRQEAAHAAMDSNMKEQYDKAVSEVKGSLFAVPDPKDEVPCRAAKNTVTECYKKYPKEVLKCHREVLDFQACVDIKRMEKMQNRG